MTTLLSFDKTLPQIAIVDINNYNNKVTAIAELQGKGNISGTDIGKAFAALDSSISIAYFWMFDKHLISRLVDQNQSTDHILYQASQEHVQPLNNMATKLATINDPSLEVSSGALWMDGPYAILEDGKLPESTINVSPDTEYRAVVAMIYRDTGGLARSTGMDLEAFSELLMTGGSALNSVKPVLWNTAAEKIVFEKQKVDNAATYVITSGGTAADNVYTAPGENGKCYWTGPVHYHSEQRPGPGGYVGYMGGKRHRHNGNQPKLRRVDTLNTTTHDYTVFERLEAIKVEGVEPITPREGMFSPLCLTTDKAGTCKGFFTINWSQILRKHVLFPNMIQEDARGLSRIKDISVYRTNSIDGREKLIVSSQQIGTFSPIADNTTTDAKVDLVMEEKTGDINTGFITELTNLLHTPQTNSSDFRSFAIADFTTSKMHDGELTYRVEISFEDGTVLLLNSLLERLKNNYFNLEQYLSDYELSVSTGRKIMWDKTDYAGVWSSAIKNITSLLSYFGAFNKSAAQRELYLLINPQSATLEGVERMAKLVREKIEQLTNALSGFIREKSRGGRNEKKSNMTISGNRSSSIISLERVWENDSINIGDYNKHGYDYLTTSKMGLSSAGLSTVSTTDYESLVGLETLKHFSPDIAFSDIILSTEGVNSDLSLNKYSFLTPNFIKIPEAGDFETFTHINNRSVALKSPEEYFNVLVDLISYKENGTIVSSEVALTEIEENIDICDNESAMAQVLNLKTQHAVVSTFSSLGVDVVDDYESDEYKALSSMGGNTGEVLLANVLGRDDAETKNSNSELEERDTSKRVEKQFSSTLSTGLLTFSLVENYVNLCKQTEALGCLEQLSNTAVSALPNQYKAMYFSNTPGLATTNWSAGMKNVNNMAFFHLMHKNITTVEAFRGYEQNKIAKPIWQRLDRVHLDEAKSANKNYILCRMRREYYDMPCALPTEQFLNMPVYDECFLIHLPSAQANRNVQEGSGPVENMVDVLERDDTLNINNKLLRSNVSANNRNRPLARQAAAGAQTRTQAAAATRSGTTATRRTRGGY